MPDSPGRAKQGSSTGHREKNGGAGTSQLFANVVEGLKPFQVQVQVLLSQQLPSRGRKVNDLPELFETLLPALIFNAVLTDALPQDGKLPRFSHAEHQGSPQAVRYWWKQPLWTEQLRPLHAPLIAQLQNQQEKPDLLPTAVDLKRPWAGGRQVQQLLTEVLRSALQRSGTPHIVQIPPGLGKTSGTIQAIWRYSKRRRPLKVLWFVREARTLDRSGEAKSSLGQETLEAFQRLGVQAQVIQSGSSDGRSWAAESPGLQVRILAHAYLPIIFASSSNEALEPVGDKPDWLQSLAAADLIVIDEDPTQSLILTEDAFQERLTWAAVCAAMRTCHLLTAEPLDPPEWSNLTTSGKDSGRSGLTQGEAQHAHWLRQWATALDPCASDEAWSRFVSILSATLGERNAPALEETGPQRLQRHMFDRQCRNGARLLTRCIRDELTRIRNDSSVEPRVNLGLRWEAEAAYNVGRSPTFSQMPFLRFSLLISPNLQVGRKPVSTVILDAYAHQERYALLFQTPVQLFQVRAPFLLQVEERSLPSARARRMAQALPLHGGFKAESSELKPSSMRVLASRRRLVRAMLDAIHLLSEKGRCVRPVLFLGAKFLVNPVAERGSSSQLETSEVSQPANQIFLFAKSWLHYLTPVAASLQTSQRFQQAYWFAGRGRNVYQGYDVVALTPPKLPNRALSVLMALKPERSQASEREVMRQQDEDAEFLQMLHRGRQLRIRLEGNRGNKPWPRVLLMYKMSNEQRKRLKGVIETVDRSGEEAGYRQLAGLPLVPGKLELTYLVAVAVAWELLSRPTTDALPGGWIPQAVFRDLDLIASSRSDTNEEQRHRLMRRFFLDLHLTTATPHDRPELRMTAAAVQRAGLWEAMPGRLSGADLSTSDEASLASEIWAPAGSAWRVRNKVREVLESQNLIPGLITGELKGVGKIWYTEKASVPEILTWYESQTD